MRPGTVQPPPDDRSPGVSMRSDPFEIGQASGPDRASRPSAWDPFAPAFRKLIQTPPIDDPDTFRAQAARDPQALAASLDGLWRTDPSAAAAAAMALYAAGALTRPVDVLELRRRLLLAGRDEEALALIDRPHLDAPRDADLPADRALALARLGRLTEAFSVAEAALAVAPDDVRAKGLVKRCKGILKRTRALRSNSPWSARREIVDGCAELGAMGLAGAALQRFLSGPAPVAADEIFEIHDKIGMLAPHLPAADMTELVRSLLRLHPKSRDRRGVEHALELLGGGRPDGADGPPSPDSRRELRLSLAVALDRAGRPLDAIRWLAQLAAEDQKTDSYRYVLARCVSQEMVRRTGFRLAPRQSGRRIFNVVRFNDELTMLDLRLQAMGDWVDRFVIVEARRTFTGQPKPLHFQDNRQRYAAYADKIVHVVIDDFPEPFTTAWARDFYQIDMGLVGLSGLCAPDDLVLITDLDEIVEPSALVDLEAPVAKLLMERSRYFLNYRETLDRDQQRGLASVWQARFLPVVGLAYARFVLPFANRTARIHDAGWHFTSVADPSTLGRKMRSFAHEEHAPKDAAFFIDLAERLRAGQPEPGWEICDLDRLPAYVRDNLELAAPLMI